MRNDKTTDTAGEMAFLDCFISLGRSRFPASLQVMVFLVLVSTSSAVFAQNELKNIVPLSPTAASIAQYGEVPVGHYTGVPDIGIPLYTITSGSFQLPLRLTYHSGGNRVESVASSVGLSWSISGLPSISRSVNGLPDEGSGGFFHRYNNQYSVRDLYEQAANGNNTSWTQFMLGVKQNINDPEPDVFLLNIKGYSGRFFYNQDLQKFVTYPISNIKVTFSNNQFTVISGNGTKYVFGERESAATDMPNLTNVTSSWLVSRIITKERADTLYFSYDNEQISTRTLFNDVKYQYISGNVCSSNQPQDNLGNSSITTTFTRPVSQIAFRGGKLVFTRKSDGREDLVGGHALDRISIYDAGNVLKKQFSFAFKFLNGGGNGRGCTINDNMLSNKWMLLTGVSETSGSGGTGLNHSFSYDETRVPPCRNSTARDYWGFHNGVTTNDNLIPTTAVPDVTPAVVIPGANREVNQVYAQFGILKRITYPTGGYTDFEYENHKVVDDNLPMTYVTGMAGIDSDDLGQWPVHMVYTTVFDISNAQDPILNQNNPAGGAYLKVEFGDTGVPPGDVGAILQLKGTSASSSGVNLTFSNPFQNYYIPNGTYEIKVTFNQNPPNYQSFYLVATWQKLDSSVTENTVGGLRVKRIRSYETANAQPVVRNFSYTEGDLGTGASSGSMMSTARLDYFDVFMFVSNSDYTCVARFMRLKSYTNQLQVTQSGSYVGYRRVCEYTEDTQAKGYTSYDFRHHKDMEAGGFPYPPPHSMEAFRGQPSRVMSYAYLNGQYRPVKDASYAYKDVLRDEEAIFAYKTSNESGGAGSFLDVVLPFHHEYGLVMGWSAVEKVEERLYSASDPDTYVGRISTYTYDTPYNQLKESALSTSNGKLEKSRRYYPYDLSLSGDEEVARQWLVTENVLDVVLKEEQTLDGQALELKELRFGKFGSLWLPYSSSHRIGADGTVVKHHFDRYDERGNIRQQYRDGGPKTAYLWGYGGLYPVAEIRNATHAEVLSALGANSGTVISQLNAANVTEDFVRSTVNTIRNHATMRKAQVTTYTYDPLIGMTSQTDASGRTTYYEYDGLGRLRAVRDPQGNLTGEYQYHYRNQ